MTTTTGDKMALASLAGLYTATPGSAGIDIQITGHERVGPNRWAYRWKQVVYASGSRFTDPPADSPDRPPLSSELDGYGPAYNTIESNNDGAGVEGSGDDPSDAPPNVVSQIESLGVGAVVVGARLVALSAGVDEKVHHEVIFTAPNNVSGACSGRRVC